MELGYEPKVFLCGRSINDGMGAFIAKKTVQQIIKAGKTIKDSKVLVMGATFKENVADIRNSKVADVIEELKAYFIKVEVTDPFASSEELKHEYGFELMDQISDDYDAIIVAVNHVDYIDYDEEYFKSIMSENGIIYDVKCIYKDKIKELTYLCL